jgi:hypothetical protein
MARKRNPDDPADAALHTVQRIPAGRALDMAVLMPGLRVRHDGWTAARTQRFLDVLAHCGCVEDACRVAGMSTVGARRMKARFPAFSAAWDAALDRAHQGLIAIAYKRAVEGKETVIIRNGAEYERRIAPSDAMLSLLLKRGDMKDERSHVPDGPAITYDEWQQHWRFDHKGKKVQGLSPEKVSQNVEDLVREVRARLLEYATTGGTCVMCNQPWPMNDGRSLVELAAAGALNLGKKTD